MKNKIKKDSSVLIAIVSSIMILMLICYLGVRNVADTYSVSTITCSAGTYYVGQGECETCLANYYCPGGEFGSNETSRAGIYECPSGKSSPAGSDSQSDCIGTTTCEPGKYYSGHGTCSTCPENYYCPGVTNTTGDNSRAGIYECPSGKSSSAGSDDASDCKSTVSCSTGTFYPNGQTQCESENNGKSCQCGYGNNGCCVVIGDSSTSGIITGNCGDERIDVGGILSQHSCIKDNISYSYSCSHDSGSQTDATGFSWSTCTKTGSEENLPQCDNIKVICGANSIYRSDTTSTYSCTANGTTYCYNKTDETQRCYGTGYEGSELINNKKYTYYKFNITTCSSGNGGNNSGNSGGNGGSDSGTPNTPTQPNNPNQNVTENPKTGSIAIFLVWIIGIGMVIYSFVYFKELKSE